jgi:hypothetical protein
MKVFIKELQESNSVLLSAQKILMSTTQNLEEMMSEKAHIVIDKLSSQIISAKDALLN